MRKFSLLSLFWVLLAVLGVSALLVLIPRGSSEWRPLADSLSPGGLGAFAELLRKEGYRVVIDRTSSPKLQTNDLAVMFDGEVPMDWTTSESDQTRKSEVQVSIEKAGETIGEFVSGGGKCLELWFYGDYQESVRRANNNITVVTSSYGPATRRKLNVTREQYDVVEQDSDPATMLTTWRTPASPFAELIQSDLGVYSVIFDATGAVNELIAKNDNAAFMLDAVQKLAPRGSRVVFCHATLGDFNNPSLLQAMGPWAQAVQWQAIGLFALIVWTYGRRFGLPEKLYVAERGTRDLVDAFAWTMGRSKRGGMALRLLREDIEHQIRVRYGLPSSTDRKAVLERVPRTLQTAISAAEILEVEKKPMPNQILVAARRLIAESEDWSRRGN